MTKIEYKSFEGELSEELLISLAQINQELFPFHETAEILGKLLQEKKNVFVCLAFQEQQAIAFKIGFQESPHTFESWRGGVHPIFRRRGIAKKLMHIQHNWCVENGFRNITTVTNSTNTAMIILNLQSGFQIIGSFLRKNILKIIQEKQLSP